MPRNRRPTIILVMAVVNLVFGGLSTLCGLCSVGVNAGVIAFFSQQPGAKAQLDTYFAFMDKEAPGWLVIEIGYGLVVILLGVLLLIAGIGLLKMYNWARWLCVACGVVLVLLQFFFVAYELGVAAPALKKFEAQQGGVSVTRHEAVGTVRLLLVAVVAVVYGIGNSVIVFLPGVGAAFSRNRRRAYEERDYRDDDDYSAADERDWDDDDWDNDYPRRSRRRPDY